MKPIIAIVGRPNVGKSTLFNRIVGRRQAIVNDTIGVTRDRHYAIASWNKREFIVVDTGGIVKGSDKSLESAVKKQTLLAIKEAQIIICLFDGREGVMEADREVVDLLRKSGKSVIYAVNKADEKLGKNESIEGIVAEFYSLGIPLTFFAISAEHGRSVDDLLDAITNILPEEISEIESAHLTAPVIAIIGRPNAGKSTLINKLAGIERSITHEIPGTTRDSIDVEINVSKDHYTFIDTAGLKRKGKTIVTLDKFSAIKTIKAIERADITLLMIDSNEGFTHQDSFLLDHAYSKGKAVLVLFNKWDSLTMSQNELEKFYAEKLKKLHNVPYLCISAKTGQNVRKIFSEIKKLVSNTTGHISTSKLNKILEDAKNNLSIPSYHGKAVKLYYSAQVNINPPSFLIFTNFPEGINKSYKRYLINRFQTAIGYGVPIKLVFKKR